MLSEDAPGLQVSTVVTGRQKAALALAGSWQAILDGKERQSGDSPHICNMHLSGEQSIQI